MGTMRLGLATAVLTLVASAAGAAPCTSSATALCLSSGRFEVKVAWTDFQGKTGDGQAVALTADTGYFWFFNSSNIELIVKVLDARGINQKFWVFFGALSNVEYTLTVTDSTTGVVKRYQNPSGQFASVGDTTAFDGVEAMPAAAHQTVIATGTAAPPASIAAIQRFIDSAPAASAFVPCPEQPFGFNLAACRFHIEVDWDDGHGGTGIGHPVQLTDDTGYFWFFNDTNVELMMKVLDARPVNGNFWVFFGALSNVRYSVTVTDSLTKAVKRYTNPNGTFASVGDTSAFVGGRSVAPTRDSAHAVSADMDAAGGSFSATGADGTVFTLDVPPGSLLSPETITLTPVSSMGGYPFSGGFNAGVEIEPEGLRLLVPATLTIRSASPPPPKQTYTYAYAKGGENFILYPMLNEDVSAIQLALLHFSGYGGATVAPGPPRPTPSQQVLAPYVQEIALWKAQEVFGLITHDEFNEHLVDILARAFAELAEPMMAKAKEECDRAEIELACNVTFAIVHLIQAYGLAEDPRLADISGRAFELARDILTTCQQKTFDRCVHFNDPFEATLMLFIAQQLQEFGVDDPLLTTFVEGGLMERCLRFEIDFESKLVENIAGRNTSYEQRLQYRAQTVPLRLNLANGYAYGTAWDGSCTLLPEVTTFQYTSGAGTSCTVTVTDGGKGNFNAAACWIGLLEANPTNGVRLLYDPGDPTVQGTEVCSGGDPNPVEFISFSSDYGEAHDAEHDPIFGLYLAKHWDPLRVAGGGGQNSEFFARKLYERTIPTPGGTLLEDTIIFLKHTPDKSLPPCP